MNYNWHKKFAKSSKVNYNELYLLGLAEKNKRKKELEEQRKVSFFSSSLLSTLFYLAICVLIWNVSFS